MLFLNKSASMQTGRKAFCGVVLTLQAELFTAQSTAADTIKRPKACCEFALCRAWEVKPAVSGTKPMQLLGAYLSLAGSPLEVRQA